MENKPHRNAQPETATDLGGEVVIASKNPGKLREFAALFADFSCEAIPQSVLGLAEADEPHATFVENALAKARHASRASHRPALADDSGICVPALGGAPGVWSARYAGEPKSDARNNEKLVQALANHNDRRAFYYCALVLVRSADDPRPIVADGAWWGSIVATPSGMGGFGYDAHFWLAEYGCTAASLDAATKNRISHRGLAMQELRIKLQQQRAFSA
jgi:XTP/dITP diphosphohydrolase